MAGELKKLFVLCLVAAFLAQFEIRAQSANSTATTAEPIANATTTAEPIANATTTAEPIATATTTAEPIANATTTAEPIATATTTAEPIANATTTAEPIATATTTAGPTTTAEAGGTDGTTATAATGGTGGTTKPQPTEPTDPCASSPCGDGSTCDPRHGENYVCLCSAGEKYNNDTKRCESAKVFPGELSLPKLQYKDGMRDKRSPEFIDTASKIVSEVDAVFKDTKDYSGATVLELLPNENSRATVWVKATVEIIFKANAEITENAVKDTIETAAACKDCALQGASFKVSVTCANKPCDEESSTCQNSTDSYTCNCNDGYVKTNFSTTMCIACPSGEGVKDGKCIACSFGYSGFNCNESWQLVLTIVGSVLSGLLLVTLILLPVVALKSSKKRSKKSKEADIGMSQVNQPTKAPMFTSNFSNSNTAPANGPANGFPNSGMPRIPRAGTNNSNLDMTLSNSRQNLIPASKSSRFDDDDDTGPYAQIRPQGSLYSQAQSQNSLYAQTRPQSNPYAQTRPQSNPYAQTRPQSNPYASSQGQSSPHFAQDLGRRY